MTKFRSAVVLSLTLVGCSRDGGSIPQDICGTWLSKEIPSAKYDKFKFRLEKDGSGSWGVKYKSTPGIPISWTFRNNHVEITRHGDGEDGTADYTFEGALSNNRRTITFDKKISIYEIFNLQQ